MFDPFVRLSQQVKTSTTPAQELYELLQDKTACSLSSGFDTDHKWLDQFAGTPLQQQAIALEQQAIQNEMAQQQYNLQNESRSSSFWRNRDQINLQKKMLELQLFQANANPAVASAVAGGAELDPPTAGAPAEAAATPETGAAESSAMKVAQQNLAFAEQTGRMLAKYAFGPGALLRNGGAALGQIAKSNPRALASAAGGLAGGVLGAATAKGSDSVDPATGKVVHTAPTLAQRLGRGAVGAAGGAALGGLAAQGGMMARDVSNLRQATPELGLGSAIKQVTGRDLSSAGQAVQDLVAKPGTVPTAGTLQDKLHSLGGKMTELGGAYA